MQTVDSLKIVFDYGNKLVIRTNSNIFMGIYYPGRKKAGELKHSLTLV